MKTKARRPRSRRPSARRTDPASRLELLALARHGLNELAGIRRNLLRRLEHQDTLRRIGDAALLRISQMHEIRDIQRLAASTLLFQRQLESEVDHP